MPGSRKKVQYDPLQRIGVGMSRLGTSEAVAIGAYAFALRKLDGALIRTLSRVPAAWLRW